MDIEGEKYEMSMEHVGMSDTITPESDGEDLF